MRKRPITNVEIEAGRTPAGGFTAKTLAAWGIKWPPKNGWRKRILRDGVPASCPVPAGITLAPMEPHPDPAPKPIPAGSIEIFTDGCCEPNPGPGGWAFAVYRGAEELHASHGGEAPTTNNRMELLAIIQALRWLDPRQPAVIWTDSEYCRKGCTTWRHGWAAKGWTRGKDKALANSDLWILLAGLLDARIVEVRWTRGHVGTIGNERADELADIGRLSSL
ncbi:ribonuclease HI [Aureimonas altamirensis]|uniref:ribonuclease H family protein n=1 Tax=Aureimonas altamirensis TaxID=370622 RepID=UPI001E423E57|nr:ribonuclease H [Aureimonas altamirensis]UHD44929.1 ribonuclease HI [Aureimonas altamirensis]